MSKFWIIFFSFITASSFSIPAALGCSCQSRGDSFFETVFLNNQLYGTDHSANQSALTVVVGKIIEHKKLRSGPRPTEMVLSISNVVQGSVNTNEILIEGDNGFQCRPYVTNFPIGKSYILALNKYSGNYFVSSCGEYSQEVIPQ